jgi:hypothetical protein
MAEADTAVVVEWRAEVDDDDDDDEAEANVN